MYIRDTCTTVGFSSALVDARQNVFMMICGFAVCGWYVNDAGSKAEVTSCQEDLERKTTGNVGLLKALSHDIRSLF